jgi:hypothetical protein
LLLDLGVHFDVALCALRGSVSLAFDIHVQIARGAFGFAGGALDFAVNVFHLLVEIRPEHVVFEFETMFLKLRSFLALLAADERLDHAFEAFEPAFEGIILCAARRARRGHRLGMADGDLDWAGRHRASGDCGRRN